MYCWFIDNFRELFEHTTYISLEPWEGKIWPWVPRDSEPRMTVLARASINLPDRGDSCFAFAVTWRHRKLDLAAGHSCYINLCCYVVLNLSVCQRAVWPVGDVFTHCSCKGGRNIFCFEYSLFNPLRYTFWGTGAWCSGPTFRHPTVIQTLLLWYRTHYYTFLLETESTPGPQCGWKD
jgi:hypothetical protein